MKYAFFRYFGYEMLVKNVTIIIKTPLGMFLYKKKIVMGDLKALVTTARIGGYWWKMGKLVQGTCIHMRCEPVEPICLYLLCCTGMLRVTGHAKHLYKMQG